MTANLFQNHKKCYLDYTRIAIKSSPAAESKSNETCLRNRDYDFVLSYFTLTSSQLLKLERCQSWFLRIIFYAPKFAPRVLLLKLSNLNSVEAEVDIKKTLILGRLITQANMAETVKSLFLVRVENYFDSRFSSLGAIPSICETLRKYDLFQHFENWFTNSIFPTYSSWKKLVEAKVCENDKRIWAQYCLDHPSFQLPKICLDNVNSHRFWSLAKDYPDLVSRLHTQTRLR